MAAPHPSARVTVGLLAALLVAVGALVAWRSVGSGSSGPSCDADPLLEEPLPRGDVRLAPFAADSPWKLPVSSDALPARAESSPETVALRAEQSDVHGWINAEQYSIPIVQATDCDPVVTFQDLPPGSDLHGIQVHIPANAKPAAGTDKHLMVIQPDARTVVEIWVAERLAPDRWKAGRVEVVDLTGSGIGPDNGVRAYGGSALGGLIRKWEVDPSDPNYVDGAIRHPLAMALPNSMLRYDGGDPGYDGSGYGTAKGYVAPATEQDYDSPWAYKGPIPMGSKVVLPASVDVASLDLPPALTTLALALQQYGAYVTDRTGDGTVAFYAEPTVPSDWLDQARGPSLTGGDLDRIRSLLVVVP